ncbi:hypothetical protein IE53DRAFT_292882, partial [Violaceomyces palustris]
LAAFLLLTVGLSQSKNFTLRDDLAGQDFFDAFYWWDYRDPTGGYVDYVSQSQSRSQNLSYVDEAGRFVLRADSTNVVLEGRQGRASNRLHSRRKMGDGILVAKFSRMPVGCGTWPAFWTCTTESWPKGGEIDIIEGANDQGPLNLASLHTLNGCTIPNGTSEMDTSTSYQADCAYQPGCSKRFSLTDSFGQDFNSNSGGWYALVRDTRGEYAKGISIYFWPSDTPPSSLPRAVTSSKGQAPDYVVTDSNATGQDAIELEKWGTPAVLFPNGNSTGRGASCLMEEYFDDHEIIINLTFCGYWAGETFSSSGCSLLHSNSTCEDFVRS